MPPLDAHAAARRIRLYRTMTLKGFEAFCNDVICITGGDEDGGSTATIAFKWWPAQRELAKALFKEDTTEILADKSRQIGITWVILAWFLYKAMFLYGVEERITSVGQDEASKALRRVKFMIDNMPDWCRPGLEISNTTTIKIAETGSWITALPATINAGRGDTINDILCDEMAFQVYAEEIMRSAGPSLEKRHGKRIGVSTANGVGNFFAQEYMKAQRGKNGYKPFFFGWRADPTRTQAWYNRMLADRGEEYVHENYPETWQQSFLATGRPYFDQKRNAADLSASSDEFHDGYLDGEAFRTASGTWLRVWEQPVKGRVYVFFGDTAEGLEKGDYQNGYVVDTVTLLEVARIRGKMDVVEFADYAMQVCEWYGCGEGADRIPALLAWEANNTGIAAAKHCLGKNYRNLYYERDLMTGKVGDRIGWFTSQGVGGTRHLMLSRLQADYRTGKVRVRDRECLEEMSMFAHLGPRGKPQAPAGKNDDCVMSRAGANIIAQMFAGVAEEKGESEPAGAREWGAREIERMLSREDEDKGGQPLGMGG